ncbi:MAG TPA: hypothetical protein VFU81_17160 [Thermomicrobiales bacterium]|nr:hypothetical protein [Thermomicrobiales bacterium]
MHGSHLNLPVSYEGDGVVLREMEWGDMNVGLERFPAGLDTAPLFKGLPDDRCHCPHWGYVIRGRLRVRYRDHEETLQTGDVYYMSPGHLPIFDEDTEVVEFSPKGLYQQTMDVAARNIAAMQPAD